MPLVAASAARTGLAALALALVATLFHAPAPAAAQTFETGFAQFGQSNTDPIEIEADALEVQDRSNVAVFSGNVTVTQGNAAMQTARLTVHYSAPVSGAATAASTGESEAETEAESEAASPATPQNQRISRLEAEGRVLITAEGQSATGDAGTVNFDERTMALSGNVTLSQAGNVVTGETLTVNLDTGVARVESRSRVRVLLTPGSAN